MKPWENNEVFTRKEVEIFYQGIKEWGITVQKQTTFHVA